MTEIPVGLLEPVERRRLLVFGLLRAFVSVAVLVALYFLLPLDAAGRLPIMVSLVVALLVLLAVSVWQIRAITHAQHPGLRAVEALALTAPLFILLFAATYFVMESADPTSFSPDVMTRIDALYLTVTTFATVGFGDITATSQGARLLVTVQMILNLLVLGGGIRIFIGAVQRGRQDKSPEPGSTTTG